MKLFVLIILGIICSLADNVKVSQFTAKVYREMAKKNSKTFLVCPLSVKIVLALVQVGARGRTADQLAKVLDLSKNSEILKNYIRKLLPKLEGSRDYELKSVNKLYVKDGFSIKKQYKNDAVNIFKADIQNIDFGNSQEAATDINRWIEEHTNNKIKDMVSQDDIDVDTALVLINAIYFHGKWVTKFNKERTTKRDFFRDPNDKISIDMMKVTSTFNYYKSVALSAEVLEMPYQGQNITMTIVLPDTINRFSSLEAQIADVLVTFKYKSSKVTVVIPKFKIETFIDYVPILKRLGVKNAFSYANFSGISNAALRISEVIQKTFIEVDEEGTTAAAGSAAIFVGRSLSIFQKEFVANRPFIFFLKSTAGVIFIGRYTGRE